MRPATRTRFIRAFMSSVLASEMTKQEIIEVLDQLPYDLELTNLIKNGLVGLVDALNAVSSKENNPSSFYENDRPETAAYNLIKKYRISKSKVLEAIEIATHQDLQTHSMKYLPVRELLAQFYATSSSSERDLFFELLNHGGGADDAFLQGILRNR